MKLKEIIKDSVFGTIATITGPDSIKKAYSFVEYNLPVLKLFDDILLSVNWNEDVSKEVIDEYYKVWSKNLNVFLIPHKKNSGHMFGTIELEESILKLIKFKYPNKKWLFKSSEDVLLSNNLFEQEYIKSQFYYLPSFSKESISIYGNDLYDIADKTPQTNFFIINITDVDILYGNNIHQKKDIFLDKKKYSPHLKPWELKFEDGIKFDMETHLGITVNDMSKTMLLDTKEYKSLFDLVKFNNIYDPSHKNIMFERLGICHYHYWNDDVFVI